MRTVRVKKLDLIKVLTENKAKHRNMFLKGQEQFQREVIQELEARLADARKGKTIDKTLHLIDPIDQTKDYDRAIAMCAMSVDDVIELTEKEFANYVQDEWEWSGQFAVSTAYYAAKAR